MYVKGKIEFQTQKIALNFVLCATKPIDSLVVYSFVDITLHRINSLAQFINIIERPFSAADGKRELLSLLRWVSWEKPAHVFAVNV